MFRLVIIATLFLGGIINTSATAIQIIESSNGDQDIEYVSIYLSDASSLETINAEEVEDDSNKWRLLHRCLLSDLDVNTDLTPVGYCCKTVFTSFILFESDNSPPVLL